MFIFCYFYDQKTRIAFAGSYKIEFGHTQISVPKIGTPMSVTVCINPCLHASKKVSRNYALSWDLTFRKTRDFEIQFLWRNKWPQHYIALQIKVGSKKWQTILVPRNLQVCFAFTLEIFPLYLFNKLFCNIAISLIENHTELAYLLTEHLPANIFLVKVNNKNTRQRCEICSKLKLKTPEPFSSVFIVHFEQANVS